MDEHAFQLADFARYVETHAEAFYRWSRLCQMSRAIVIFARTPEQEAAAKRLPIQRAAALFRSLLNAWARAAKHVNAEVLRIEQTGDTFGERLANSADAAFALGFDAIVLTGIDVAPPLNLESAFQSLEAGRSVIAPARDGGVNLIGLCAPERELLSTFTIRDRHLAKRCRAYFRTLDELPLSSDIDTLADFYAAVCEDRLHPVYGGLKPAAAHSASSSPRAPPIA